MGAIPLFLIPWLLHVTVAAVVLTPAVLLARKRVRWRWRELWTLVIPFAVWAALMLSDQATGAKSLSNLVVEPALLGLVVGASAWGRLLIAPWWGRTGTMMLLVIALAGAAAGVFFLIPALPE